MTQTVINDKGEEVTEDVWEEDPAEPETAGDNMLLSHIPYGTI